MQRFRGWTACLLGLAASLAATHPANAAGFGIFEQGSKAMGMAGAFTAQADDPSAMFHNVGGLAFQKEREFLLGATIITATEAEFDGANPFPGEGYHAEQELLSEFPPHLYYVAPINGTWKWGIGVNAPFGLVTEWERPNQFAGRFLSTRAALESVDVNPTIGWQISPSFGLGFGAIGRFSRVELERNAGRINPFTQRVADIAHVELESDMDSGFGWNVGLLHKATPSFSWGLSYRSSIEVEYGGDARLTQILTGNPVFDTIVGNAVPFNQDLPIETAIEFPDMASLGFAFGITDRLLVEADVNWTGWSSFDEVEILPQTAAGGVVFTPETRVIPENWDDAMNYRVGLRWGPPAGQWRVGYVLDETPQPEEAVSPLLPDADRNGITLGFGHESGQGLTWDIAVMYLDFDERVRDETAPLEPVFHGTYNTKAYLFGVTLGWQ